MATAPAAIWHLYDLITVPSKVMSGIVGDVNHSFGYHLARNELPAGDYSVTYDLDRRGDAGAASALDIKLNPADMITVTNRLLRAAIGRDPRLGALREFCGTTDGRNTHPYDLARRQDGPLNSWDATHLWHVHLSFYRAYANNATALAPIADVINGVSLHTPQPRPEDDDMRLVTDSDKGPELSLLLAGGDVFLLSNNADRDAYLAAGIPTKAVSHTSYNRLRDRSVPLPKKETN